MGPWETWIWSWSNLFRACESQAPARARERVTTKKTKGAHRLGFVEKFHGFLEISLAGVVAFDAARHASHQVECAGLNLRLLDLLGSFEELEHSISQFLVR